MSHDTTTPRLGTIYLPKSGTRVGEFGFLVDDAADDLLVEIGTPVVAETGEGAFVGIVQDLSTVGTDADPVAADLAAGYGGDPAGHVPAALLATVQVFESPARRPVGPGTVRGASPAEVARATGREDMDWPLPAGVVRCVDGTPAPVCVDGHNLLGPEAAHMIVSGLSGWAAKTSFSGVLLASALAQGSPESDATAAVVFNVKGSDLLHLDQPDDGDLTDDDRAMYTALELDAGPFADVEVWAPGMPQGQGANCPRGDAIPLRWGLRDVWPYLRYLFPWIAEDEKLQSFMAAFADAKLYTGNHRERVASFAALEAFLESEIRNADDEGRSTGFANTHVATLRRIRRMLGNVPARGKGLIDTGVPADADDLPATGWRHGQVVVVDIAGLGEDMQAMAIARTLERLLGSAEEGQLGVDHLAVFADELNSFAPAQGSERAQVRRVLRRVSTQGRYAGVSLWGAAQQMSKIDDLVRDNAGTRAVGKTTDGELADSSYGRMSGGLAETITGLERGQMALSHHTFRAPLVVDFPRPAWHTGKPTTTASGGRADAAESLTRGGAVSAAGLERLTEGMDPETAERIVASSASTDEAVAALQAAREPDMTQVRVEAERTVDPDDPFGLDD